MDYHAILIDYGKPIHRWVYHNPHQACLQLDRLNFAYEEVKEFFATLVKSGLPERDHSPLDLLRDMIFRME